MPEMRNADLLDAIVDAIAAITTLPVPAVPTSDSGINAGLPKDVPLLRAGTNAAYSGTLDGVSVSATYTGPTTGLDAPWRWDASVTFDDGTTVHFANFRHRNAGCACLTPSSELDLREHNSTFDPTLEVL